MEAKQNIYCKIGRQVAFYRKKQGLTQSELAEMIHRSYGTISRIERGKYNKNIPLATLLDIACALGINVIELLK